MNSNGIGSNFRSILYLTILIAFNYHSFAQGKFSGASLRASEGVGAPLLLAPGDLIEMRVWREDDMETRGKILRDGSVALPLLGDVVVGGMSVKDAKNLIQTLYNRDYLVNPQVFLTHTVSTNMSTFLVLGHVNTPGLISIPEGKNTIDFLEGIGLAGGFTRLARPSKVIVKRKEGNTEEIYEVNADKLARDAGKPFLLQNGDKVTVTERFF
jgi:protein involved in polysaccharide export with SLBB domain